MVSKISKQNVALNVADKLNSTATNETHTAIGKYAVKIVTNS